MHHRKRRHLFSEEQNSLALLGRGRNYIRNCLRFAGSWWPLNDQITSGPHLLNHFSLRRIRIHHVEKFVGR